MKPFNPGTGTAENRVVWWLLGILSAIALSVTGAWVKHTQNEIDELKDAVIQLKSMPPRLERVEDKLDWLIKRSANGPVN